MSKKKNPSLADWMDERGTSNAWIAAKAKTTRETIRKIKAGETVPGANLAAKISAATKGEVPVSSMLYPAGIPRGAKF